MQNGDRSPWLEDALEQVAEDESSLGASPCVEERLRIEVRAISRARRLRTGGIVSAIAVFALVAGISVWRDAARRHGEAAVVTPTGPSTLGGADDGVTAFFPLGYSAVPMGGGRIVRIEVPRAALASFGVAPVEPPGGASAPTALADVLIGEDGLARAVRFVRAARIQEQKQ